MKSLILIGVILLGSTAFAETIQFHHLQPTQELNHRMDQYYQYKNYTEKKSIGIQKQQKRNISTLGYHKSQPLPIVDINEGDSPLFMMIKSYLNTNYQQIGQTEVGNLLNGRNGFNLGSKNFSGFLWQKPFGEFVLAADRRVIPDPNSDQWIVTDKLQVTINAMTYLKSMNHNGFIKISKDQLAAFAGLKFQRVYTYRYYVPDFKTGLTENFDKLFLSFKYFHSADLKKMKLNELITREDYFSFQIGGGGQFPIYEGISIEAGVLHERTKLSKISIESLGAEHIINNNEFLRVSVEKEKSKSTTTDIRLMVDFYNLLKLTLLSFEYTYSFTESEEMHLSFRTEDAKHFTSKTEVSRTLKDLIKMKKVPTDPLLPFLISREQRIQENINSKFRFLMFGQHKKKATEQVTIESREGRVTFITSTREDIKYTQGLLSTFLNSITQTIFRADMFGQYKSMKRRAIEFEYREDLRNEEFSLTLTQEYGMTKDGSRYREQATDFIKNLTTFSNSVIHMVNKKKIVAPLKVTMVAKVHKDGVTYFDSLSRAEVDKRIINICKYDPRDYRFNRNNVPQYMVGNFWCHHKISWRNREYQNNKHNSNKMWKLNALLESMNYYSQTKDDYIQLFGKDNVYLTGKIQAKMRNGSPYTHFFQKGKLKSAGVIEDYMSGLYQQ
ncbi:MAG: hypothetical protein MK008_13955 [Bdellovibrionales bacterium]|nr:hypothetical protein [Bdellovibrionales bacterium]